MYASNFIRAHIYRLAKDKLFCNRDFLKYGSRDLVDRVLSDLTNAGAIVRLARGVYRKHFAHSKDISISEIAIFKAKAFGRKLKQSMTDSAIAMGLSKRSENSEPVFMTDGCSSSFVVYGVDGRIRIHFQRAAVRKTKLEDDLIGTSIKALWHFGNPLKRKRLDVILSKMDKKRRQQLRDEAKWMPAWMADVITACVGRPIINDL